MSISIPADTTNQLGFVELHETDADKLLISHRREAQLVFLDPPFNYGRNYDTWDDQLPAEEYHEKLRGWISCAHDALTDDGSLWLNLPDEWAANAVVFARDELHMTLENWCLWHYRFGVHQPSRFIRSKSHALWFSKGDPYVNEEAALVPSDRAAIYNDSRIYESARGGMRMDLDVWGFDRYWGRVQGNNKERRPLHDNQLPEVYLKRIIGVCSKPGDLVIDPFCGSGTTATVARAMGRNCITGDISAAYIASAAERVKKGLAR